MRSCSGMQKQRPIIYLNVCNKGKDGLSGEELNLLFYGDVASIETTERYIELSINRYFFGKGMTLVNKLVYDLASEVLINSRITIKKYNCFKNAVKVDFMALVLTIIFLCVA